MLLLTFPCSLHGTMNCSGRSKSLAGPTLLLFLQIAQGNLGCISDVVKGQQLRVFDSSFSWRDIYQLLIDVYLNLWLNLW